MGSLEADIGVRDAEFEVDADGVEEGGLLDDVGVTEEVGDDVRETEGVGVIDGEDDAKMYIDVEALSELLTETDAVTVEDIPLVVDGEAPKLSVAVAEVEIVGETDEEGGNIGERDGDAELDGDIERLVVDVSEIAAEAV